MKPRATPKTIKIPLLPSMDNGKFLITCKPLNIFIQAESKENAKKDFEMAIDVLFKHLKIKTEKYGKLQKI